MKRISVTLFALLLTIAVPGASLAAPYQIGVTTEDDVSAKLGQPDTFTLQPDGGYVYAYKLRDSLGALNYFPIFALFAPRFSTTATFTFDPSTRLTSYSAT